MEFVIIILITGAIFKLILNSFGEIDKKDVIKEPVKPTYVYTFNHTTYAQEKEKVDKLFNEMQEVDNLNDWTIKKKELKKIKKKTKYRGIKVKVIRAEKLAMIKYKLLKIKLEAKDV